MNNTYIYYRVVNWLNWPSSRQIYEIVSPFFLTSNALFCFHSRASLPFFWYKILLGINLNRIWLTFFFLCLSTGVPSSPRNVISIVNETSVILEWHSPRETGGRDDVVYNIVCKKCRADRRSCSHCDDNVDFVPRQLGLTETRVFISNLWAHTLYSFEIQAVNGVSNKSPYPAQHVSIDITTNQAGKWLLWSSVMMNLPHRLYVFYFLFYCLSPFCKESGLPRLVVLFQFVKCEILLLLHKCKSFHLKRPSSCTMCISESHIMA